MIQFLALIGILLLAGIVQLYANQRKVRSNYKHFKNEVPQNKLLGK
ncbi:hypothetical protein [Liquorilactobacillus capillatus]|nr:hypothetical protein [Liquorilactobacillus capillatus]